MFQFWPFYSKNQGINLQQKISKTPQIFRTKNKRPIHRSVELKKQLFSYWCCFFPERGGLSGM